jgi:hypothetical protein
MFFKGYNVYYIGAGEGLSVEIVAKSGNCQIFLFNFQQIFYHKKY